MRCCILVYEILEKGKILDLTIERAKLTGLPMDRVSATIASLDFLYLQKEKEGKQVELTENHGGL